MKLVARYLQAYSIHAIKTLIACFKECMLHTVDVDKIGTLSEEADKGLTLDDDLVPGGGSTGFLLGPVALPIDGGATVAGSVSWMWCFLY